MKKVFMPINRDSEKDIKVVGEKIAQWRYEMGLSQQNVADATDIARSTIDRIERGQIAPRITTLIRICAAFDVPITRFMPDDVHQ